MFADPSFSVLQFPSAKISGISCPYWIVFRKDATGQAQRLKTILLGPETGWSATREREIGRILGYDEADIDAFVAHVGATSKRITGQNKTPRQSARGFRIKS